MIRSNQLLAECTTMCPMSEIISRLEINGIHKLEMNSESQAHVFRPQLQLNSEALIATAIKQFRRATADTELNIPSEVRTPRTLWSTFQYIQRNILSRLLEHLDSEGILKIDSLAQREALVIYTFVFDRFRMIVKDFSIQRIDAEYFVIYVQCLEEIAKSLIAFDSVFIDAFDNTYVLQHRRLNTQLFMDILKTLQHLYRFANSGENQEPNETAIDISSEAFPITSRCRISPVCPHIDTFTAYYMVMTNIVSRSEFLKYLMTIPKEILEGPRVVLVINLHNAAHAGNYSQFFSLLTSCGDPYLAALFVCHDVVADVRWRALRSLCTSFMKSSTYPISKLSSILGFRSKGQTIDCMRDFGLDVETDTPMDSTAEVIQSIVVKKLDQCIVTNTTESSESSIQGGDPIFQAILANRKKSASASGPDGDVTRNSRVLARHVIREPVLNIRSCII